MALVDSQCRTFQAALEVLGRPWFGLLLNVLQAGPLRFSEIRERAQGPGDKILSARLKELEARGLVERRVVAGRTQYRLTPMGEELRPAVGALRSWAQRWL